MQSPQGATSLLDMNDADRVQLRAELADLGEDAI
jgi:hypothetical protein